MYEVLIFLLNEEKPVILHGINSFVTSSHFIRFFNDRYNDVYSVRLSDLDSLEIYIDRG